MAEMRKNLTTMVGDTRKELTTQIIGVRTDLTAQAAETRKELTAQLIAIRTELTAEMGDTHKHFAAQMVGMRTDLDTVRKELASDIKGVSAKVSVLRTDVL